MVAHRGASAVAPENTLAATRLALAARADWIETDTQPSRDGVPFVLHDRTVTRTTNGTGAIRKLTAARLKKLDAGSWFARRFTGARLPTLAQQLAYVRRHDGRMIVEIKGPHTKTQILAVVRVIRAQQMTGRVLLQSFDEVSLRRVRQLAPELPIALLRTTIDKDPVAVSKRLGLAAYNPKGSALLARPGVVARLHTAGVAVFAWTEDSAARWKRLDAIRVDGIITNKPADLVHWKSRQVGI
ncbi:glycerophosphodiester phosphodiesterase [Actinoplanes couchii]|uniref:Hydrolase n=1 Tax=Actinoplanes couchii TaxID=403638 RepID=A0ABQ3X7C6_9ACTN|nr:glycerophosphodiester phosphodiesterase family protein [Actinoplanes couchii]MDR6322254.1 glycerophosphoryl diester phosphodiesterase [Actinoplanes couchii]GID54414.1 hydrolase [Actinoplanes couchii]